MSYSCKHWFNSNGYQNLNYVWGGGFGGESGYHIQNLNEFDCLEYSNEGGVRVKKICYWEGEVKVIYYSTKTSELYIPGLFSNHR